MLTIRVEGYEIDLAPLEDVLASTGLASPVLDELVVPDLSDNLIWNNGLLRDEIAERLAKSIPEQVPVEELPRLPDQLALLLRSELTVAANKHPLDTEEKDEAEQLLQDLIRPLVYHLVERHYAEKPVAEPEAIVCRTISETIVTNWQSIKAEKWEIRLLDSLIGPIGYEFRTTDEVMYSKQKMTAKGDFFYTLAVSVAEKMFVINLD